VQAVVFLLVLLLKNIDISYLALWSLFFTLLKLEILLAIVFFFSSFMSNILTILVSLMIYVISHSYSLILDLFLRLQNTAISYIAKTFQLFFPPLEALNVKDVIGTFSNFPPSYFFYNTIYSFLYILILLFFTVTIFQYKKFED